MSLHYAQTNIQLYNQMRDLGYATYDIAEMKNAYDFSLQLFSGQYRANGKPFINHLVGTASILLAERVAVQLAIVALLHAAYSHGHFSLPFLIFPRFKRRKLRQLLGSEQEGLIYSYTHLKWNKSTVRDFARRAAELDNTERHLVIVRIANEIEDHLDFGLLYCAKSKSIYQQQDVLQLIQELATALEYASLARQVQIHIIDQREVVIPESIIREDRDSFHVPARLSKQIKNKLNSAFAKQRI